MTSHFSPLSEELLDPPPSFSTLVMLLLAGLAPLVVLATGVVADPSLARDSLITFPISKRINFNGIPDFTKRDRKHSRNLVKRGCNRRQSSAVSKTPGIPLNNTGGIYAVNIGVGDPPTYYQLLVDSGSALTWVGGNKPYVKTKSSVKTKESANITYTNGFFQGPVYNDTVTISKGITISQQYIGVASKSSGTASLGLDGILGIGPNVLTLGSLSPDNNMIARTVTDNLFHQGKIQKNQVAVSFVPTNSIPNVNGELTFGGVDSTKYIGKLHYFPIATDPSTNEYWSADATFQYGDTTILKSTSGIFDTGSTLLGLATNAYNLYVKETGAVFDKTTGLLKIDLDQYKKLQSLYFNVEDRTYEFNANAQAWPRALNVLIGGEKDAVYLVVSDLGPGSSGFVAGMAFLERFYVVFDSRRHRVGLANTQFTNSTNIN